VSGAVQGSLDCLGSFRFTLTATAPAGTVVGSTPAVFLPLVNRATGATLVSGYTCSMPVPATMTVTCVGTEPSPGLLPIQGGTVTIRFLLATGLTADVTGTLSGPGGGLLRPTPGSSGLSPIGPPLLPPPPPPLVLPPPPVPLVPMAPPVAQQVIEPPFAVPVIPESDTVMLLLTGLLALAAVACWRRP
jgi:hypothetical protein